MTQSLIGYCSGSGDVLNINNADRCRGYTHCPDCGRVFKVALTAGKTKTLPRHKPAKETTR